jgi:dipeptide/tripeptide permease
MSTGSFVQNAIRNYFGEFGKLRECPREFWVVNVINFLDSLGYFAFIFIAALFFTQTLGIADDTSQTIVGGFLAVVTIFTLVSGIVSDALGIRKAFLVAFALVTVGRGLLGLLGFTTLEEVGDMPSLYLILGITAMGQAFVQPPLSAAIRRYTSTETRGAGFNLWYLTMQLGAIAALFLLDFLRISVGNYSLMLAGSAAGLTSLLVTFLFIKREEQLTSEVGQAEAQAEKKTNPLAIAMEVLKSSAFWRFMLFVTLIIGVRMSFAYAYVVNPKYYTRVLGDDAWIGSISNVNPIIIMVGLVILVPYLKRFDLFKSILLGAILSAGSLFVLALPLWTRNFLGVEIQTWYYIIIFVQIVVFALGEMVWSPRFSEYTASIAPAGREATYMAFAQLPTFFSKMLTGFISGYFLVNYCPEKGLMEMIKNGEIDYWHSPEAMWFWFAVIAISSPILLIVFNGVINKEKREAAKTSD